MKTFTKFLTFLLKGLIVLAAVGNLALLFLFDYQIPFLHSGTVETESEHDETDTAGLALLQLFVPSKPIEYDGTGKLDLMDGVVVRDLFGIEQSGVKVFSTLKSGSSRTEKIVEYSVTDENGTRITAERTLRLSSNYIGPNIEILGTIPDIEEEELDNIVALLTSENLIFANDGFGSDVTSSITSTVKSQANVSDDSVVTLSIVNMLNDSFSTDVIVHTQPDGPVLKLTTDKVTISVGDSFSFYEYIAKAEDEEGNSLFNSISMNGSVDPYTPGEYVLEFYCTDSNGTSSPVKRLTVTVK